MVSTQNQQKSSLDNKEDRLSLFLKSRGFTSQLKQGLHITSAQQGSGRTDISINHDQIISEKPEP